MDQSPCNFMAGNIIPLVVWIDMIAYCFVLTYAGQERRDFGLLGSYYFFLFNNYKTKNGGNQGQNTSQN